MVDFPASYVSLPEGTWYIQVICVLPGDDTCYLLGRRKTYLNVGPGEFHTCLEYARWKTRQPGQPGGVQVHRHSDTRGTFTGFFSHAPF